MLDLNYNALIRQAQTALANKEVTRAQRICEDLALKKKNDPTVLLILSRVAVEQSRNDDAVRYLEKCIALDPKAIGLHLDLALTLQRMGKNTAAIARLEKARRLQPNNPWVLGLLADTFERAGELDKARELLEPIIKSNTDTPAMATVWAKMLLNEKKPHDAIAVLTRHLNAPKLSADLWFALGQAYERTGEIEKSFNAYCAANQRATQKFDLQAFIEHYREIIAAFNRQTLQRIPKPAHDTSKPIFIAGRPRSGTTLVEKILDSHPDVTGVGELAHLPPIIENLGFEIGSMLVYPQCIRDLDQEDVTRLSRGYLDHVTRLAPSAKRTVDKNLENYQMLGPIAILFPQGRAIHIRRETIDNCWSIFVANMNYAWCSDLHTLGVTQGLYEGIMRHWHRVLDLPILDVDYEAIVEDQQGWTQKILEFCGLSWDERCLRFYEEAGNKKDFVSAPTLSYHQVRQPIYKTAVGRAVKFESYLGPLREGLKEGRRLASVWTTSSE